MKTSFLHTRFKNGGLERQWRALGIPEEESEGQRQRCMRALEQFVQLYGEGEISVFSSPGRSEIGGNHTDHQHGKVLAAAVHLDMLAFVRTADEITLVSEGYPAISVSLEALEAKESEQGTTTALIKGVLAGMRARGYRIGGFQAYVTSNIPTGAGLSSSAAFEVLIGTILSVFYNGGEVSPIEVAMIAQYAENVYFGKPCGLMDQTACAVGNAVYIDFKDPEKPVTEQIDMDLQQAGYCLCITDTKGSHADLTDEYAAIPKEMGQIAGHFHKKVLREVTMEEIFRDMRALRDAYGDRAVLRAIHYLNENERVDEEKTALKNGNFAAFLDAVKRSGDSSYKYLQNIYAGSDVHRQNLALAISLSEMWLCGRGVCRVHGGGFAGTIQSMVPVTDAQAYCNYMDSFFGEGSCRILNIRKYGAVRIECEEI